jgi:hypothetical protein
MTAHGVPEFCLRFPSSEITFWADRYQYADDAQVERIGERAGRTGCYTLDDLLDVARWKTRGRSVRYCERNTDADVRSATALALTTTTERDRIATLIGLHGVQLPTASVLLHLAHHDPYPIIDYRALWSLSVEAPASYAFGFWWAYTQACRSLADKAGVSMRTLDRALWQYSKENQPSSKPDVPVQPGLSTGHVGSPARPQAKKSALGSVFPVETYVRLVAAAIEHHTIPYSALPGTRRTWGRDLYRIAGYEHLHGGPPLTALVVHKQDGRPGTGFVTAMAQVGYDTRPGESADDLWKRALAEVFAYWNP